MPIWFLMQTRRSFTRRYRRSYLLDSTKLLIGLSRPRWWEEKLLKLPGSLLTKAGSATLYQLRTFLSRERPCCKNSSLLVSLCQVRFLLLHDKHMVHWKVLHALIFLLHVGRQKGTLPLRQIIIILGWSYYFSLCIHVMNEPIFIPLFQGLAGSSSISMQRTFLFVLLRGISFLHHHIFFSLNNNTIWAVHSNFQLFTIRKNLTFNYWMQWLQNSHTSLWSKNPKTQRALLTDASHCSRWWSWGQARKACPWRLSRCI